MGLQGWGEGQGPEDVVPGGKEIIGIMTENSSVHAYPTLMSAATGLTVRKAPIWILPLTTTAMAPVPNRK
jgi:hypothetical protein